MFWIVVIEAIALLFSFFAMRNVSASWQNTRDKDLPLVAKIIFVLATPLIVGIGLALKTAWWWFVIFFVVIGVMTLLNQEGLERQAAWRNVFWPLAIGASYTYAGWLDKVKSVSFVRFPLIIILAAGIFALLAGLVNSVAIIADEGGSFSSWFKHNWKTMLLVIVLVLVGLAAIRIGLWAFS